MPANLPPDYFQIEERYRTASSNEEKIAYLEEMLSVIPKHKGTEKLIGDLRKRLSKLKNASETNKGVSRHASVYQIDKEGAGQIVLVGHANVGKSALVTALTNADPEVAEYPFTTWVPTPGMMAVYDIQIQIIDTPPINSEYVEPELLNLIRRADLIWVVVDIQAYPIEQMEDTLAILNENRIYPNNWKDRYLDDRRLTFKPIILVVNKCDDESLDEDFEVFCELVGEDCIAIPVSATTGRNFDRLQQIVFEKLDIIRVYSKPPGEDPDLNRPYVMKKGSTVEELAGKVHKDFLKNLKSARVWGSGAFEGQMVSRDYVLQDEDIVELKI